VCRAADDFDENHGSGPFPGPFVGGGGEGTGTEDEGTLEVVSNEQGEEDLASVTG
jgi:hypothetical protein